MWAWSCYLQKPGRVPELAPNYLNRHHVPETKEKSCQCSSKCSSHTPNRWRTVHFKTRIAHKTFRCLLFLYFFCFWCWNSTLKSRAIAKLYKRNWSHNTDQSLLKHWAHNSTGQAVNFKSHQGTDWKSGLRFPVGQKPSLCLCVETSLSPTVSLVQWVPGLSVTRAWSWPFTSILYRDAPPYLISIHGAVRS